MKKLRFITMLALQGLRHPYYQVLMLPIQTQLIKECRQLLKLIYKTLINMLV